jgi:biotin transport system substrate-specific component
MVRRFVLTRDSVWITIAQVAVFAALTALAARITIPLPNTPVPITLQTMAVVLAGLMLGARGGALSQLAYLSAIAVGLPLDAYARGSAALAGPTAGYLWAFIPAAFVAGFIAERAPWPSLLSRLVGSLAGMAVIYALGAGWLMAISPNVNTLAVAWAAGIAPFILPDLAKAVVAALVAEGTLR